MRIKEIEIPDELLDVLNDGKLVVFAGAGVSAGHPANLPNFKDLVVDIAKGSPHTYNSGEPLERYLGRLDALGVPIYDLAKARLEQGTQRPTPSHKHLLRLFKSLDAARIVTTNFDPLFDTASIEVFGQPLPRYYAPALPVGNNFQGLVYLHGALATGSRSLVLTDSDFGRAYLTEGWARRFLLAMFSHYTVLFVGYSHNDVVMTYLARGLSPTSPHRRYALVPSSDDVDRWKHLGITAIAYPNAKRDGHKQLVMALDDWATLSSYGTLDTERRVIDIVNAGPPLDKATSDYILRLIRDPISVLFFVRHATSVDWLLWLSDKKALDPLFLHRDLDESERRLAIWVAETFAIADRQHLFQFIGSKRQRLNPFFLECIVDTLWRSGNAEAIEQWTPVVLSQPDCERTQLSYLLDKAVKNGATVAATLLFAFLTRPKVEIRRTVLGRSDDLEIDIVGDDYWARDVWQKGLKPNLGKVALSLWPPLTANLWSAHLALRGWGAANDYFDYLSWRRSAIEPHPQDRFSSGIDIVIDAVRDILEWMAQNQRDVALSQMELLAQSESPLQRRIAIHAMTRYEGLTGSEKLRWALNKGWLFDTAAKHELFQLLKAAYPEADQAARSHLFEALDAGPDRELYRDLTEDVADYERYNLLLWLARADKQDENIKQALADIQSRHPEFLPREHLDFSRWSGGVRVGEKSPKTVEELLQSAPSNVVKFILSFQGQDFRGPTRYGLLNTVFQAAKQDVEWGLRLALAIDRRKAWNSDVWAYLMRAWGESELSEAQWAELLAMLQRPQILASQYDCLADLLQSASSKQGAAFQPRGALSAEALHIAEGVWRRARDQAEEIPECDDWLTKALNHPGGKITLFWLEALSNIEVPDHNSKSITEPFRSVFQEIVADKSLAGVLGRAVIASQVLFLFDRDPAWTRCNVLPLLDWAADQETADQAWDGYLAWGKWNNELLANLLPLHRLGFARLPTDFGRHSERFIEHVAAISVFWLENPLDDDWLKDFVAKVSPSNREDFASKVGHFLLEIKPDAASSLWDRWLHRYWLDRNMGMPAQLSVGEVNKMAEWIPLLGPAFSDAVDLFCSGPRPEIVQTGLFHWFDKSRGPEEFPAATAKFLARILESRIPGWFLADLEKIAERIIAAKAPKRLVLDLCDKFSQAGSPNALALADRAIAELVD